MSTKMNESASDVKGNESDQGWMSGRVSAEALAIVNKCHEVYVDLAVSLGWPRPRRQDTFDRILREGGQAVISHLESLRQGGVR